MKKSPHAAGWTSESPTPAQLKEFAAQVESGRITRQIMQMILRGGTLFDFKLRDHAREILSDDIIFPDEIPGGYTYAPELLQHLADTLPSDEILRWCAKNNYAVVAPPPTPLSLLGIRGTLPELFSPHQGRIPETLTDFWDTDLVKRDRVACEWLVIRKAHFPRSEGKTWNDQQQRFHRKNYGKMEKIASPTELAWFSCIFFRTRGVRLFGKIGVRTWYVAVSFRAEGLVFENNYPDTASSFCGLATAFDFRDPRPLRG